VASEFGPLPDEHSWFLAELPERHDRSAAPARCTGGVHGEGVDRRGRAPLLERVTRQGPGSEALDLFGLAPKRVGAGVKSKS
jgi:hypothetical protein